MSSMYEVSYRRADDKSGGMQFVTLSARNENDARAKVASMVARAKTRLVGNVLVSPAPLR